MKTIGRILIILVAALVVVGITMAIGNTSGAAQAASPRPDGQQFQPGGADFLPSQRPDGNFEGRERGEGFSFGWIKNILVIAVIVIVFLAAERLWNILHRQRFSLIQNK